jgi:tetratricopeptide (TPR) repeat protein
MQPLITTLLTLSTLLPPSSAASSYDSLCETIVSHAQAAARLHNSGEAAAAVTEAVASVEAYRSAVELEPSEPQAYLYAGQAMYNMQRFDEAIGAFTAAGEGHPHHGTSAPRHHGTSQESAFLPTGTALAASPGVSTSRRACALRGSARRPSRATRPTPTGRAT